ncbi:RusA family crossover junction endodeoxyribonuclease [Pseudomonas aeruginosa]|uniref:RusA family crossover junction endodeoxyribonuclease n=3 Tax=Pseudomonas aeruginosa TaxID=287 RepID=UPI0032B43561
MADLRPVMFTVPGEPVGKGRPRAVSRKRRDKVTGVMGSYTAHITPKRTEDYEEEIGKSGTKAMAGRDLLEGPVLVELDIALSIPQSMSKKRKSLALAGGLYPTKKPDMDNVIKAIYDGLNGVVWKDDVQVVKAVVGKRYGETPGVRVKVVPLLEGEQ